MADSSLQEALKDHGSTFSGLLGLLPAKIYYGEGQSNPYGKPKQSKAERAAAKRGRLDPDSSLNRTAKEELEERESHKRKLRELEEAAAREEDVEGESSALGSDIDVDVEREAPREGLKTANDEPKKKKQKTAKTDKAEDKTEKQLAKEAKKAAKKEAKRAKSAEKKKRREARMAAWTTQAREQEGQSGQKEAEGDVEMGETPAPEPRPKKSEENAKEKSKDKSAKKAKQTSGTESKDKTMTESNPEIQEEETVKAQAAPQQTNAAKGEKSDESPKTAPAEVSKKPKTEKRANNSLPTPDAEPAIEPISTTRDESQPTEIHADTVQPSVSSDASSPASGPMSPTFDAVEQAAQPTANNDTVSATTSVSSMVPPSEKPKHITIPDDMETFRERFQARMAVLREQRKAPGTGERPARSRKELMEQRQKKEAERKARKKEEIRLAKLEEARKREEALAANSPSAMSPATELDETTANLSFTRVAFSDNTQLSHDLSYVLNRDKKKGPSDPKTALLKLQNQKKRLAEMGEEKRDDVEDKEAWLTARRRAEGEKIRDDETLLKKAVKRKDRQKRKSEREWSERANGVGVAQKAKQKKREENIKQRKDEKVIRKIGGKKALGIKKGGGSAKKHAFQGGLGNSRR